ncbi:hypothetical protein AB205_0167790, partial [Aquarana catesbeiana]
MVPLKVFLAIVAEVAVLVGVILGYELLSKKKHSEDGKTFSALCCKCLVIFSIMMK